MWTFLNGPGCRVDIPALHTAHPEIRWTTFAGWARSTFAPARRRGLIAVVNESRTAAR
ncbi:hypothetical protein ACWC0C_27795 [Streptomyces sp. NPDC001709]